MDPLVTGLALIGIVIVVSALLSGLIDKTGLPHVAVFILIGAALGPAGLGVFNLTLQSPVLRVVATLSLTLVLFTDAVTLISWPVVIFAAFSILIRIPVYLLSLLGSKVDRRGRAIIAWYGPSGLSSLLLILLAVFSGMPGSDRLFAICSLIVLISIVLHGISPTLLARLTKKAEPEKLSHTPEVPKEAARSLRVVESPAPAPSAVGKQSLTLEELDQLQKSGEKAILLDVRTERSRETSDLEAEGSVRMLPENVVPQARELKLPKDAWLIAYCA